MNEDFFEHIKYRGYVHQCTNEKDLKKKLSKSIVGYIGFDCTADSLHVGSLLPLMLLHKPYLVLSMKHKQLLFFHLPLNP